MHMISVEFIYNGVMVPDSSLISLLHISQIKTILLVLSPVQLNTQEQSQTKIQMHLLHL